MRQVQLLEIEIARLLNFARNVEHFCAAAAFDRLTGGVPEAER
jgi:hypothetical protein